MTENGRFIGQERLRDKQNKIPAIPRLLELHELNGSVMSIYAIGIQVNNVEQIVNAGGRYFWDFKENQGSLL